VNKNILIEMLHRHDEWDEIKAIISIGSTMRKLSNKYNRRIPFFLARQRLHPRIKWEEGDDQLILIIAILGGHVVGQEKKGPGRKGQVIVIPEKCWPTKHANPPDELASG
jgi:hypothetical protein